MLLIEDLSSNFLGKKYNLRNGQQLEMLHNSQPQLNSMRSLLNAMPTQLNSKQLPLTDTLPTVQF